jgi:hypothetical protein
MSRIDFAAVVWVQEGPVSVDLGGETAILDVASGRYFSLNAVAAEVWEQVQHPVRVADIHAALTQRYAVDSDRCGSDLLQLLDMMRARNLIRVVDAD